MIYNTFGENFYVKGTQVQVTTDFLIATWPWFMTLLFVIAGASSAYALKKRTVAEYMKERVYKLLIPFLFSVLLLTPVQTYFAERFHNAFTGNYFEQYILYFTKPTDLSGYQGGFAVAHLWFVLYLFIISIVALPFMLIYKKSIKKFPVEKIPLPLLLLLSFIPVFSKLILNFSGKSVGEYLTYFLFGYFFISSETIQEKLQKYRWSLLGISVLCMFAYLFMGTTIESFNKFLYVFLESLYAWISILAILGMGKQYLNFSNRTTEYLSKASFPVYIFHQQWVVAIAYFTLSRIQNIPLQMIIIIFTSIIFTFFNYEIFKRFSATRFMFGMKK